MGWNTIHARENADYLMRIAEHFHDWYLAGFEYDPLARVDSDEKNLARFTSETDAPTILFRYDSVGENGDWPELELQFLGVYSMGFSSCKEPDPFYECRLEETARGWAFVGDDPLTDEERNCPQDIKAGLYAVGGEVRWRPVGGTLWALEHEEEA